MAHDSTKYDTYVLDQLKLLLGAEAVSALEDPLTTELMLNPDGLLWADKIGEPAMVCLGRMHRYPDNAESLLKKVAGLVGKVINADHQVLECAFPLDGSRFEALIPPACQGPMFSMRKHASMVMTLADYVNKGVITPSQSAALKMSVTKRHNILVVGGTSSGKTTFANAILDEIATQVGNTQRIAIIEDKPELKCNVDNKYELLANEQVGIRDLLKASMRLRPDRIVIGELRGGEALDLLSAWNSGHEGGICTLHANNAAGALKKLELYVQQAPDAPDASLIPLFITMSVNAVAVMTRNQEGARRLQELVLLNGLAPNGDYDTTPIGG